MLSAVRKFALGASVVLASCGGGGGSGSEGNVAPPAAPTLAVSFGYKVFHFTWSAVPTTTSYRLSEDPDGVSGYTIVASNLSTTNYDHALVSLFGRINAKYKLEACNGGGCTSSVPLNMPDNLSAALGAYAKASNTGASDGFGAAVALSTDGNTLAVGATGEDGAGTGVVSGAPDNTATGDAASGAGAVYVLVRSGATWSQQAYLKASNTNAGDAFGLALSLSSDGNTLAVGAPFEASNATTINGNQLDNSASGAGAVYIFTRSGTTWTQQTYVKAFNAEANDFFGFSVALSGDGGTLAVGAIGEDGSATVVNGADDNLASNSGAVYVYFLTFPSTWNLQAYVKASNTGAGDSFGLSVSLSGDGNMLAVGAPLEDSASTAVLTTSPNNATTGDAAIDSGAAYTFKRASNAWSQHTYIKASNAEAGDRFGTVVALSSDARTLAVSAPREASAVTGVSASSPTPGTDSDAAPNAGAVYVFNRILTGLDTWAQQAYIKASNAGTSDEFGVCIALSGDGNTLAVGAAETSGVAGIIPGSPDEAATGNAAVGVGAVYRFTRSGTVWQQEAYVKATNPGQSDGFGITQLGGGAVALNGDGSTLAVGALGEASAATGINGNQADNSATNAGAVYLY
jgi:hypothetical protein